MGVLAAPVAGVAAAAVVEAGVGAMVGLPRLIQVGAARETAPIHPIPMAVVIPPGHLRHLVAVAAAWEEWLKGS